MAQQVALAGGAHPRGGKCSQEKNKTLLLLKPINWNIYSFPVNPRLESQNTGAYLMSLYRTISLINKYSYQVKLSDSVHYAEAECADGRPWSSAAQPPVEEQISG